MRLVKLNEYNKHIRQELPPLGISVLRKWARQGKIPGAFQQTARGDWWVDLDYHNQVIQERIQAIESDSLASCDAVGAAPVSELGHEDLSVVNTLAKQLAS
jgi:hypothetical protein